MSRAVVPIEWKQQVAARLQQARDATGMTQQEFADLLGIEVKTYAKYEMKKKPHPIPQNLIIPICEKLDLDPYVLLTGCGKEAERGKGRVRRVK